MRANHTPHLRAVRMRRIRRRSYLADGIISIYCIKVIPPPDNDRCRWCGCPTDPGEHCEICGTYHAYGQLYEPDPPPVGAALPEPKPFCPTCNREVELRNLALLNGAYFCRFCTGLVNWPLPESERPHEWTRSAGDGAAICRQCKQTFFQADGEECLCHRCWAADISLGGITPPWPGGAA